MRRARLLKNVEILRRRASALPADAHESLRTPAKAHASGRGRGSREGAEAGADVYTPVDECLRMLTFVDASHPSPRQHAAPNRLCGTAGLQARSLPPRRKVRAWRPAVPEFVFCARAVTAPSWPLCGAAGAGYIFWPAFAGPRGAAVHVFKKILIANRGEIACRVIRTARRMGIKTVAVYSEADAEALHVQMADEAVAIGPAPSAQSYLQIEKIIQACKDTGAQAVHPGYGFLSENQAFAAALRKAGIKFIGPPRKAVAAMGDKIESKKLAKAAGVNTVPGHLGVIPDAAAAVKIAREIGYPVMIKASAGGGGKGMRIAHSDAETEEGFRSATAEAKNAFADDRVFVEKFVEQPRHIEIQVLADAKGNCVYLGERECSIQRRHQKVIEEAPAPNLARGPVVGIAQRAAEALQRLGYDNIGTVEMLMGEDGSFGFLEVNTRLQVEHAVTEMVTGLDLVAAQIRAAAGEALERILPPRIGVEGHAVQARIYAEDPRRFIPSPGRLTRFRLPRGNADWRIETGYREGMEVTPFYDPLLAKAVVRGRSREEAISGLRDLLAAMDIEGPKTNIPFLLAMLGDPRFRAGEVHTGLAAEVTV